jgi:16S rRNA (guanine527-N7)-methyltransferase
LPVEDLAPLAPPADLPARLEAIGAPLTPAVIATLGAFLARMLAVNEHMNLTSIRTPEEAWSRHVLDSLTLLPLLAQVPAGGRLIDIGSGGGLPGLALAITRPDLSVTLVESIQKKAAFLRDVSRALDLENVEVRAERAEQLAVELGGSFDVVTARAVARLAALVPLTVPFAKAGGVVLLIKGQRAEEELREARAVLTKHRATHQQTVATPTGRIVVLTRGR